MEVTWGEDNINALLFSEAMKFIDLFMKDEFFCLDTLSKRMNMKEQYVRKFVLTDPSIQKISIHSYVKPKVKDILLNPEIWLGAPNLTEGAKNILKKVQRIRAGKIDLLNKKFIIPASSVAGYIEKYYYVEEGDTYKPLSYEVAYMLITQCKWHTYEAINVETNGLSFIKVDELLNNGDHGFIKIAMIKNHDNTRPTMLRYIETPLKK